LQAEVKVLRQMDATASLQALQVRLGGYRIVYLFVCMTRLVYTQRTHAALLERCHVLEEEARGRAAQADADLQAARTSEDRARAGAAASGAPAGCC
jgi:hypothetical protein